jgi:hypothetical protein
MVKNGPWIPVVTWFGPPLIDGEEQDRSHRWQALVRTETTSRLILMGDQCPVEVDDVFLRNIESVSERDYRFLLDHTEWAASNAPSHPEAKPTKAVDLRGKSIEP